jgi:hypothetical protein
LHGVAERNADVFDGMVLVNVKVPFGGDGEIEGPVASDQIEHVIEETDAGGDLGLTAAVETEADADIGLGGLAMDCGRAAHASFFQMR